MAGWIQQEKGVVWTTKLSSTDFSLCVLQDNIFMNNIMQTVKRIKLWTLGCRYALFLKLVVFINNGKCIKVKSELEEKNNVANLMPKTATEFKKHFFYNHFRKKNM